MIKQNEKKLGIKISKNVTKIVENCSTVNLNYEMIKL